MALVIPKPFGKTMSELPIDWLRFYSLLPEKLQEWLTLPWLQDTSLIPEKDQVLQLLQAIYALIRKVKGTADADYNSVHKHIPSYVEFAHDILIGLDEAPVGNIDYLKFFNRVQRDAGGWLTLVMLKKPDRMVHNQMEIMCNLCSKICKDSKSSDPDYEDVVLHLPKWISHVVVELTKAEHGYTN